MDKMIQWTNGSMTITNDGATILKQMQILHPANFVSIFYHRQIQTLKKGVRVSFRVSLMVRGRCYKRPVMDFQTRKRGGQRFKWILDQVQPQVDFYDQFDVV